MEIKLRKNGIEVNPIDLDHFKMEDSHTMAAILKNQAAILAATSDNLDLLKQVNKSLNILNVKLEDSLSQIRKAGKLECGSECNSECGSECRSCNGSGNGSGSNGIKSFADWSPSK